MSPRKTDPNYDTTHERDMDREPPVFQNPKLVQQALETVRDIKPELAGLDPAVQGAVLAELLSIWLAGHAPAIRETILTQHIAAVRELTKVNEDILFGDAGHPSVKIYYCTICGKNPVDAYNGFDTCQECLDKQ